MQVESLLSNMDGGSDSQLAMFALLNLGLIESIENGLMSPDEAIRVFYKADNCLFVKSRFRDKTASEIMSRGV